VNFTDKYTKAFKYLLPAPFTIAVSLTIITFIIAFFSTRPFWALPLLGITGLKAKEILPYTLFLMVIGAGIIVLGIKVTSFFCYEAKRNR